ncbi:MAG: hypothetical protein Q4G58_13990 [bacterium]|nr:hypothetical protein [bacterium]
MKKGDLIKFQPGKEVVLTVITVLLMWIGYYGDTNNFKGNELYGLIVSMGCIVLGLCVAFPAWWVVVHQKEGIQGLGITTKKMGLSLIFTAVLATWRYFEIREYIGQEGFVTTLLYNGLAIWEVMFIFGWLFTRYQKAFGKIPAIGLTAISVGIYHIGTLSVEGILSLCLVIIICSLCYGITNNIFTLWPVYWTIGCSASTLKSGMVFPAEMIPLSAIVLAIQIVIIGMIQWRYIKKSRKDTVDRGVYQE